MLFTKGDKENSIMPVNLTTHLRVFQTIQKA